MDNQYTPAELLILHRIDYFHRAASAAYRARQLGPAAECFRQALELAQRIQDPELINYFRSWVGTCCYQLGRLKEALAALTPLLQKGENTGDSVETYHAMIRYIETAQRLPVSLGTIQTAYAQTERFLHDIGQTSWRHELLVMMVRLHLLRGAYSDALSTAQEAWVLREANRNSDYPGQVADFHLDGLVTVCLRLTDSELAKNYLLEWQWQSDEMPVNREVRLSRSVADVLRFEGRVQEAIDWARRAVFTAEGTDYQETKFASYVSLVRAYLAAGEVGSAGELLKRLSLMRRSESKHDLYNIYLLLGDYRLSCACAVAGLGPLDLDYQIKPRPLGKGSNGAKSLRFINRAKKLYNAAERVGSALDQMLKCDKRRREITLRREQADLFEIHC